MAVVSLKVKQAIKTVKIGNTSQEGGTRSHSINIGGEKAMPFIFSQGEIPNPPVIAYEVWDAKPKSWNPYLGNLLSPVWDKTENWCNFLIEKYNAPLIFLRLISAHPDYGAKNYEEVALSVKRLFKKIKVPFIIIGTEIEKIDRDLLPKVAEAVKNEGLLLGNATTENYKEITQSCIDYGHSLITESPIDINIAKQVNILVQDYGLEKDKIVMYATTGALGYGLEYAYSIMEKSRLLGLEGDSYMDKPQIAFVGQETWRAKESLNKEESGIIWETTTGEAYLHSGADIIVIRHPESGRRLQKYIKVIFIK